MSFLKPKTIEETILRLLESGEKDTRSLLAEVRQQKENATKQGFYAALRKLKAEEAVVVYKGTAALHATWINDMENVLQKMRNSYTMSARPFELLPLSEKESVAYSFSTIRHLDSFWGHAQTMLMIHTPKNEAIYAYNPHYWFYIARATTERKLLEEITGKKRQFLMTVATDTQLDRDIAKDFKDDALQYVVSRKFPVSNNYYVTAIGDYTIEVFLEKDLAKNIDDVYKKYKHITPEVIKELQGFLTVKSKNRIKITRSHTKAERIRKALSKSFFVKN